MPKGFTHLSQPDAMDCGSTCLAMIAKHYGKNYTIQNLREMCSATRAGVSMLGISDAAEKLGFKTLGVKVPLKKLAEDAPLPCIVHWKQEHFVVVYDIKLKIRHCGLDPQAHDAGDSRFRRNDGRGNDGRGFVRVADPAPPCPYSLMK